ncbi:MAG TPA: hypothetical protein VJN66_07615, partial [Rhodanobacteraceae bacterium]|nr:hypothetical protein [Rhodanobacteraceae bacterium]
KTREKEAANRLSERTDMKGLPDDGVEGKYRAIMAESIALAAMSFSFPKAFADAAHVSSNKTQTRTHGARASLRPSGRRPREMPRKARKGPGSTTNLYLHQLSVAHQ